MKQLISINIVWFAIKNIKFITFDIILCVVLPSSLSYVYVVAYALCWEIVPQLILALSINNVLWGKIINIKSEVEERSSNGATANVKNWSVLLFL